MKKRIVAAAAFAACLALCAAVWSQSEPVEETPAAPTPTAVSAAQPKVPEVPEIEEIIMPEEEKADVTQPEPIHKSATNPEPTPTQTSPGSEAQVLPEQNDALLQESVPAQVSPDSTLGDMVYVPGFGWLENQGPNHVEYAEDMYENGNKIGSMG